MFRITYISLIGLVCLCLSFYESDVNYAQALPPVNDDQPVRPFSDITLEVNAPSQSLIQLQPIPIVLHLKNTKSQRVLGYASIGFGKSPLSVAVRKKGSVEWLWIDTTPLLEFSRYKNVAVRSGECLEAKEWLALGLSKYFPQADSYELKVVLANADRTQFVESNAVILEIKEPAGLNRLAYKLIKESSFEDFLFSGANINRTRAMLEALENEFPDSPYGINASYVLGEDYFHRNEYNKALPRFVRLDHKEGFIFKDKVKSYLSQIRMQNLSPGPGVNDPVPQSF